MPRKSIGERPMTERRAPGALSGCSGVRDAGSPDTAIP